MARERSLQAQPLFLIPLLRDAERRDPARTSIGAVVWMGEYPCHPSWLVTRLGENARGVGGPSCRTLEQVALKARGRHARGPGNDGPLFPITSGASAADSQRAASPGRPEGQPAKIYPSTLIHQECDKGV